MLPCWLRFGELLCNVFFQFEYFLKFCSKSCRIQIHHLVLPNHLQWYHHQQWCSQFFHHHLLKSRFLSAVCLHFCVCHVSCLFTFHVWESTTIIFSSRISSVNSYLFVYIICLLLLSLFTYIVCLLLLSCLFTFTDFVYIVCF